MVAVVGLGRTKDGSLLSSEDISILQTASGYIAVAVENSLLYQEQERRAEELALLKEFNESIVESVNVGLIAVDEFGHITRCNTTFEEKKCVLCIVTGEKENIGHARYFTQQIAQLISKQ